MTATALTARRLLERVGGHPVISMIFDLDPGQFGAAPARASQLRSLLDEANRTARSDGSLGHDDRKAIEEDLRRLEEYVDSGEAPVNGARALAIYSSSRDGLFEAIRLSRPAGPRVVIARTPYVEPLVASGDGERWSVTLVDRRRGRIFEGQAPRLGEAGTVRDQVHGKHQQGGWSQANYERSTEDDAEHHLRHVAAELYRHWQRRPFARLALGGPQPDVDRFTEVLHNDLRPALVKTRLALDVEVAGVAEVQAAVAELVEHEQESGRTRAVTELDERVAAGGAATLGTEQTLQALNERRVECLVLAVNFAARGGRCPTCGLLYAEGQGSCPADGTECEPVADLREAAVEAAVLQDAGVIIVGEGSEAPPPVLVRGQGIAALLRF